MNKTADELAYERYKNGEYTYEDYLDVCEQEDCVPIGKALDKNGNEITNGDIVLWTDPETNEKTEFFVYDIHNEELVKLYNDYSECEALPSECEIIFKI